LVFPSISQSGAEPQRWACWGTQQPGLGNTEVFVFALESNTAGIDGLPFGAMLTDVSVQLGPIEQWGYEYDMTLTPVGNNLGPDSTVNGNFKSMTI
jgi:hypothetical protein